MNIMAVYRKMQNDILECEAKYLNLRQEYDKLKKEYDRVVQKLNYFERRERKEKEKALKETKRLEEEQDLRRRIRIEEEERAIIKEIEERCLHVDVKKRKK